MDNSPLKTVKTMLQTISKKNSRTVILLLAKFNKLHFGALKKKSKIEGKSLTNTLNELLSEGLITKEYEDPSKRTAKVYYSLTTLGKEVLEIYELTEELERKREAEVKENFGITINGDVNGGIIIGNNSKVHIKKH